MSSYTREKINITDILLDAENPLFASYFERLGKNQPTQDDIMLYMMQYESVSALVASIRNAGGLHPADSIVCIKQDDKYIVLEGNRRVSACKMLLNSETDKAFIDSISFLDAVVYSTREQAQPYISDKHIDGVKKWESIEKSSYFHKMFWGMLKINSVGNRNVDAIITEIVKITGSKRNDVKECILKYSFFMSVYNTLLSKYRPENLTETSSYLPLVDRFMSTIIEESDLGLNLPISDELCYAAHKGMDDLLNPVLFLTGEAFIARKTSENKLKPIISTEINTKKKRETLIQNNERIPGLLEALNNYKTAKGEKTGQENNDNRSDENEGSNTNLPTDKHPSIKDPSDDNNVNDIQDEEIFEPPTIYTPRQILKRKLGFTKSEYESFVLDDMDNDGDAKIRSIIIELSKLDVTIFQFACTMLYLHLLEAVTRKVFDAGRIKASGIVKPFPENSLAGAIENVYGVINLSDANRGAIKNNIKQQNLIKVLNDYKHNPKTLDSGVLVNSWASMKEYIKACLI